jgi:hypothetical protein
MVEIIIEKPKFNQKEYMKMYNQLHKDKIAQRVKEIGETKVWCDNCECFTRKDRVPKHKRTLKHIRNVLNIDDSTETFDTKELEDFVSE